MIIDKLSPGILRIVIRILQRGHALWADEGKRAYKIHDLRYKIRLG